jgi:transposase
MGGKRPFSLAMERPWVLARLEAKPDLTLRALLCELRERGIAVSYYAVWNIVHRAGKSFKKNPARRRAGSPGRGSQARILAASST